MQLNKGHLYKQMAIETIITPENPLLKYGHSLDGLLKKGVE